MNISTLLRFLVGDRQAIIDVATCKYSLWLGLLFVISAGFAREYDGEDLLHEPWYLLLPLVASFVAASLLFAVIHLVSIKHSTTKPKFSTCYSSFLSLFWMTAPLAWIYAIPTESLLSVPDAVRANLWMLALVSLWRVLLMSRCVSVLYGTKFITAFFLVMFFADTMAIVIVAFTPMPIFNIMGGIHLTEVESIILNTHLLVQFFSVTTWLVWFIGLLVISCSVPYGWETLGLSDVKEKTVAGSLWAVAIASILIWLAVLPSTQPMQQRRYQAEKDLEVGRIEEAIAFMAQFEREDFPIHWDLPPRIGYGESVPNSIEVLKEAIKYPNVEWIADIYFLKIESECNSYWYWGSLDDEELELFLEVLPATSRGIEILQENREAFQRELDPARELTAERKALFEALLAHTSEEEEESEVDEREAAAGELQDDLKDE